MRVQVHSGKGELSRCPAPRGVRSRLDFSIGAGGGAHVTCWFVIFNPLTNSSLVLFSTFILLREGKNLSNLPKGKNALLITSKPKNPPQKTKNKKKTKPGWRP